MIKKLFQIMENITEQLKDTTEQIKDSLSTREQSVKAITTALKDYTQFTLDKEQQALQEATEQLTSNISLSNSRLLEHKENLLKVKQENEKHFVALAVAIEQVKLSAKNKSDFLTFLIVLMIGSVFIVPIMLQQNKKSFEHYIKNSCAINNQVSFCNH